MTPLFSPLRSLAISLDTRSIWGWLSELSWECRSRSLLTLRLSRRTRKGRAFTRSLPRSSLKHLLNSGLRLEILSLLLLEKAGKEFFGVLDIVPADE